MNQLVNDSSMLGTNLPLIDRRFSNDYKGLCSSQVSKSFLVHLIFAVGADVDNCFTVTFVFDFMGEIIKRFYIASCA